MKTRAVIIMAFRTVVIFSYLLVTITIYRSVPAAVKALIALFIHPLISEISVGLMRLDKGKGTRNHPFYDHLESLVIELTMCLFKRFLFVNTDSVGETVLLVVLSGFEEVFMRATLESREVLVRKLTGKNPLSEEELKSKRIVSMTRICNVHIYLSCIHSHSSGRMPLPQVPFKK